MRVWGNRHLDPESYSRAEVEQITAALVARHWPPDASGLPLVTSAYPRMTPARRDARTHPAGKGRFA